MKKVLILLMMIVIKGGFTQTNETSKIGLYTWKEVVLIQPCYLNGDTLTMTNGSVTSPLPEIVTKPGQKFRVLRIIDGVHAIIQILDYTKESTKNTKSTSGKNYEATPDFYKYNYKGTSADYRSLPAENVNSRNYDSFQAYFKVGMNVIDDLAVRESMIKGSLAAGVINFPFKYRVPKKNTDFSGAFNFGAGIGYTFPHKSWRQFTHSIMSGYSISTIVLDSSNSDKNQGKLASTNNFSAFSFSIGYLIQYQNVQAGIFLGWDKLSKINQRQFEWQYQGKPWISVGFGLAIFSKEKEKTNKKEDTDQD